MRNKIKYFKYIKYIYCNNIKLFRNIFIAVKNIFINYYYSVMLMTLIAKKMYKLMFDSIT